MRTKISTSKAPAALGPYSQAILVGNLLFISGQIPLNPQTNLVIGNDIKTQTKQVLENLQAIVAASQMRIADVVKCSCFLKNLQDFADFNKVYTEFFGTSLPARECLEVAKLPKDVLIEISAIAVKS
jgi:2-iminobutanoate/2-iminopropanoate deaminase